MGSFTDFFEFEAVTQLTVFQPPGTINGEGPHPQLHVILSYTC